jgi:hypothetical protein
MTNPTSSKTEYKDFKDALRDWSNRPPARPTPPPAPVPHHIYQPNPSERVVGGNIIREPIDRVAARVVAKAPWWAMPPDIRPQPQPQAPQPVKKDDPRIMDKGTSDSLSREGDPGALLIGLKKEADFNIELASGMEKHHRKSVEDTEDLVRRAKEATAAIDYLVTHYQKNWADFEEFIKKSVKELRQYKMALEVETRQTLNAFKDVRNFFFDDKHEEEVARLREFVDLCQRLQQLKESGFLDSIADTMLGLAIKKKEEEWQ